MMTRVKRFTVYQIIVFSQKTKILLASFNKTYTYVVTFIINKILYN